ncbi:thiamine pyrophosphate-dependent enzyme [Mesorhizobium sp. LHD-90]|uniref:alpha-ketoacid dehydrogenase subunit alpha/beta n=1 Tax=Mesorhizobium sp. LHD-90 TaxID=3071414 RepID=UPI0027E09F9B|nr:thiamine pyrophosphate-dependent enzyme [Mesorhizobium sp. LHD-90]MDQ6434101.1 thiamine pyrophosphate-dependent enzyme [Mesorhizobium sp. LHD-90]
MARKHDLTPSAPWYRIETDESDWAALPEQTLVQLYGQMKLIRRFEEKILDLEKAGLVHGPAHASIGQEAAAVGVTSLLRPIDQINGTHRAHHQVLSKLVNAQTEPDFDIRSRAYTPPMNDAVYRLMAEIMGLTPGYCEGRGGSMHMRDAESGVAGTSAIVGGNIPHAAGYALADQVLGRDGISVSFFGDGASLQGAAYESMNIAAAYKLPVIFFVENNLYAVSTHIGDVTAEPRIASRGPMLGFTGIECDGMDVVAVYRAVSDAIGIIREGRGPVIIEAQCYRYFHQSGSKPGSEFGYRSREEEQEWIDRDPLRLAEARLASLGILDNAGVVLIDERITAAVQAAADRLTEPVPGSNQLRIPERLWPSVETVDDGILADPSETDGLKYRELEDYAPDQLVKTRFVTAAGEALAAAMAADPTIVVLGEDVHRLRGGVSGFTRSALEQFPGRVLAMPIAENGFTGVALGAALRGLRPVVEIMFGDFCLVAADQIGNGIAKVRHMFGDGFPVPVIMRVRVSPHTGYGSQHSGDPAALFRMFPGWHVVSPTTAFDYVGLLNTALKSNDPVAIIEHVEFYQRESLVPRDERDFCLRIGKAKVARPGAACTVLATSAMVPIATKVANDSGIDAEVIDMRSIGQLSTDWPLILASIAKTNRVIIAEQVASGFALGRHWIAEIQARAFDDLDHEILHVTGSLSAPVVSAVLNKAALGSAEKLREAMELITENA